MITDAPTDCGRELARTHADMMIDGCRILVTARQLEALKACLDEIKAPGDGLNYVVEVCFDYSPGHNLSWENDGTRQQDDEIDRLVEKHVFDLVFIEADR